MYLCDFVIGVLSWNKFIKQYNNKKNTITPVIQSHTKLQLEDKLNMFIQMKLQISIWIQCFVKT